MAIHQLNYIFDINNSYYGHYINTDDDSTCIRSREQPGLMTVHYNGNTFDKNLTLIGKFTVDPETWKWSFMHVDGRFFDSGKESLIEFEVELFKLLHNELL